LLVRCQHNTVTVTGPGSVWNSSSGPALFVGEFGSGNALNITNGARVYNGQGLMGYETNAHANSITVIGSGSVWSNHYEMYIGFSGFSNALIIAKSGTVYSTSCQIGWLTGGSNNTVTVTDPGSVWNNSGNLSVGCHGTYSLLTITNSGTVFASNVTVGVFSSSTGNVLAVVGGNLVVTNGAGDGTLDIRRGTLSFNGGTIIADRFFATNGVMSALAFNGGILSVQSGTVSNGSPFILGDGSQSATLNIRGGTLLLMNGLTNNGVLRASNGAVLESYGPVVNNGVIDVIYGNTNFHSTFINNGIVLTAEGDPDGDGMSNLQESLAGTIVTNSLSCLRITSMAREGDDVRITWTAVGGKSYVVQTNSVPGSGFADFSSVIYVPGVGESVTNYVHTGGATNAAALFYRVRLGP